MNLRGLPFHALATSVVLSVLASSASAAPSDAERCAASKMKAAGNAVYAEAKCQQKAITDETAVDPACTSAAGTKLSIAYGKAEDKGGCLVTGDAAGAQSRVDACVSDLVAAITGDVGCAAVKMKAAGKKTSSKAKCWQKGFLAGGDADPLCLSSAESKFTSAVAKADSLGMCTDTAPVLEALVDDCISGLVDANDPTACALDNDTTPTANVSPDGCAVLDRDTSACDDARTAQGLSGYWLKFSCRVTLTKGMTAVSAQSDGQPDYLSNYFATANACHETYTGGIQNPNLIAVQSYTVGFPLSPNTTSQTMAMTAVVGLAINGVPIFGNFAAPGDNIFDEAATFDRCGAHPQMSGKYHYHSEPYAITYDDSNFVGVMRDGYPIYGRRDPDNSFPSLDGQGGHTGVTVDSPMTPVYHYHVNQQVNPMNAMDTQWFLTTGTFHGTPGSCTGGC
jgi:hypothetical protein